MTLRYHNRFFPGDVLRVRVYGGVLHEGIYTDHGTVISSSRRRGGVFEETISAFSSGRPITNLGPLSDLSRHRALARARIACGKNYHVLNDNCQHFVRYCYGLKPRSHQRDLVIGLGAIAALLAIL